VVELRRQSLADHFAEWRRLLGVNNFGWLWVGQVLSQIGDGVSKVALLYFVYDLTDSAMQMTVIGILETIPPLVLGAFAGVYLDRIPKKAAMIGIDVTRAVLLTVIPLLYASGLLTLMGLYILVFVIALFSMAFGPALSAAVPLLVRENQLTQANAIMQSSVTIGQLFGPAISGLLIAVIGATNALYVTAGTFLFSVVTKFPLKIPHRMASGPHHSFLHDLNIGVRFVFVDNHMLLGLMLVASLFMLGVTGFIYLLPMIGKRLLHADAVALGWLWSALSIGILSTTVWLAWRHNPNLRERLWMIAGASIVGGLAVFALTMSPVTAVAALFLAAIGGSSGLVTPIVSATLQEMTPKDLLARVFGVFNTGVMAFAMLGMTVFGWAADTFGPVISLLGIGVVTLVTGVMAGLLASWCQRLSTAKRATAPRHA
jgi:DHA3 family macrolide efflux protein-like MFS transporter